MHVFLKQVLHVYIHIYIYYLLIILCILTQAQRIIDVKLFIHNCIVQLFFYANMRCHNNFIASYEGKGNKQAEKNAGRWSFVRRG